MTVDQWLSTISPAAVYLVVGGVVGLESLGIPLPGEIALVTAALLSSRPELAISPVWVALAALAGAVIGDSIGYAIGRRWGVQVLGWAGRRFPRHFGPRRVALAEAAFAHWGTAAVFVGRFIALLRIFAGPLAGMLRMPYSRFMPANVAGGLVWTAGTTTAIYFLGVAAESWLQRFSYVGLVGALIIGLFVGRAVTRRLARTLEADATPSTAIAPATGPPSALG